MANESSVVKWYVVFDILAKVLVDHYNKYNEIDSNPGEMLYRLLLENDSFAEHHTWIRKFDDQFGTKSVDPIHIFASFNHGRAPEKNRTIRLKDIFRALNIEINFEEINFEGCPAPQTIRILSVRKKEAQNQIWEFFHRIYNEGASGLKESDFSNYKSWFGLEFASITIFLFWIRSDSFLPIDKNTRTFIVSTRIVEYAPKNYQSYIALLDIIGDLNQFYTDSRYDSKGIFRELTHLSYLVIAKGLKNVEYSKEVNEILSNIGKEIADTDTTPVIGEILVDTTTDEKISEAVTLGELGFKMIAIKPLTNCDEMALNNIKKDVVYHFEKTITITEDEIIYHKDKIISLYDLNAETDDKVKVNVSAIVGKNGSGKSSLIELFFRIINNLAYKYRDELNTEDLIHVPGIYAEFYYVISGQLLCLHILGEDIQIQEYTFDTDIFKKHGDLREFSIADFSKWFYTIAVNYSLYALNSDHLDHWIEKLFHKNDSYQTPLVINPMRTRGNININTENELVKYRLLSNLFSQKVDSDDIGIRQITKKQKAVEVEFELNKEKTKTLFYKYETGKEVAVPYEALATKEDLLIEPIERIFSITFDMAKLPTDIAISQEVLNETKKYIIRKLVKIAVTYTQYLKYFDEPTVSFELTEFENYLQILLDRKSHITYKLMQAINYLKHPKLFKKEEKFTLSIQHDSDRLWNYLSTINDSNIDDIDIIEFLPPPIFKPKIILVNEEGKTSDFQVLSSGEKQLIHTVNSILYHINNLDSVKSKDGDLIKYRNINLLLDEIELYYHPEMQREYLAFLLKMIERLPLVNIDAINICFVTHSPFILSDIPSDFTLKLIDGAVDELEAKEQTFGANIHDLLANDFFMQDGFIGKFAQEKIQNLINYIKEPDSNQPKKKAEAKKIINIIGEPFLKEQILDMYFEKYPEELDKEQEIRQLEERLKKLKQ